MFLELHQRAIHKEITVKRLIKRSVQKIRISGKRQNFLESSLEKPEHRQGEKSWLASCSSLVLHRGVVSTQLTVIVNNRFWPSHCLQQLTTPAFCQRSSSAENSYVWCHIKIWIYFSSENRGGGIWTWQQNQICQLPNTVPWWLMTMGLSCLVYEIWPGRTDGQRTDVGNRRISGPWGGPATSQ